MTRVACFLLLYLSASSLCFGADMYKCTNTDGSLAFQSLPCPSLVDSQKITVKGQKPGNDVPMDYFPEPERLPNQSQLDMDKAIKDWQKKDAEIWDGYYRDKCSRYTKYHDQAVSAWDKQRRSGYKEWLKTRMINKINKTESDMNKHCAEKYQPEWR